mmetsp:Transcript_4059/g.4750  ORF Transcript_4059/g.4750 Transcript_4059/m.4750 type:complete len:85 (+) Transcript_4059:29-283(+)
MKKTKQKKKKKKKDPGAAGKSREKPSFSVAGLDIGGATTLGAAVTLRAGLCATGFGAGFGFGAALTGSGVGFGGGATGAAAFGF